MSSSLTVDRLTVLDLAQLPGTLQVRQVQGFSPLEYHDELIIHGNGLSAADGTAQFGQLALVNSVTSSSATGGSVSSAALPLNPSAYIEISINGTARKIPYY
jgi:hypothetical protein